MSNDRRKKRQRPKRQHRQRPPKQDKASEPKAPTVFTIDAIGLASIERDQMPDGSVGPITSASSATYEAESVGNILVLKSAGQPPMVIGWGFIDAIADAVQQRRERPSRWARFWRWVRRA